MSICNIYFYLKILFVTGFYFYLFSLDIIFTGILLYIYCHNNNNNKKKKKKKKNNNNNNKQ